MAATMTSAGELTFLSFPIEKTETTDDGDIVVYGKASDGSVDSDEQIVDPKFCAEAIQKWLDTGPNVRVQHQAQRDPAGVGISADSDPDGASWVKSLIVEPVAKALVSKGALRAYSVGIARPQIVRDAVARGGRIMGGDIVEISLVDRPANKNCGIQLVKSDASGEPEWVGKVFGTEEVLLKYDAVPAPEMVELSLPTDVNVTFTPTDMAKILARKSVDKAMPTSMSPGPGTAPIKADDEEEVEKDAEVTLAEDDPEAVKLDAVDADEVKILDEADFVPKESRKFPAGRRRELATSGNALPDGSYPIPDADALRRAAILARSGHGNVSAARRLIARRAKELGVKNPLKGKDKVKKERGPGFGMGGGGATTHATMGESKPEMTKKGKKKVVCPGCGAMQNKEHNHCSECGQSMAGGAMPVEKNHDFMCLGCGKQLDKGEKFCPGCGKANPGYLPEADKKIPVNKDEGSRVAKAKNKKGKGKKEPFGGRQAPAFGSDEKEPDEKKVADEPAEEKAAEPEDEKCMPNQVAPIEGKKAAKAKKTAKAKVKKKKKSKGGFGHTATPGGASGAVGEHHEESVPHHREPDGDAVTAFEGTTGLPTNKNFDPEMAASIRLKNLGIPRSMGMTHDMCCPAYKWDDIQKSYPGAHFGLIDLKEWQQKAQDAVATAPLAEAANLAKMLMDATTLKTTTMDELLAVKGEMNKAFRDANPGPGSFPTPGDGIHAQSYNRPYIGEGHGAASPGYEPPNKSPIPNSTPDAGSFQRTYIDAGHASQAPENHEGGGSPTSKPSQPGTPSNVTHMNVGRPNSMSAMQSVHDNIANSFPGVCSMHAKESPPARGVTSDTPRNPGAPEVGGVKKKAVSPDGLTKKQRKKMTKKLAKRVLRGKVSPDTARTQLGMKPPKTDATMPRKGFAAVKKTIRAEIQKSVDAAMKESVMVAAAPESPIAPIDPALIKSEVERANKVLGKRLRKELREQRKMLDALAGQPDPKVEAFRGYAQKRISPQTSGSPADAASVADVAERTQLAMLRELQNTWRNSPSPEDREIAWAELTKRLNTPEVQKHQ